MEKKFEHSQRDKISKDLHLLATGIQDTIVNSTPIEIATVIKHLRGMEAIVKLLIIEGFLGAASRLRSSVCLALDEISQNKCFAEKELEERLRETKNARAQLDQQDKAARAKQ